MHAYVFQNEGMRRAFYIASKAAKVNFPVLIIGETGVGKEVLARYIHEQSERSKTGAFVSLNCTAIPDNLIESELFGYVKGAFTGASQNKTGLLKLADGGTLFLDEIGDMSLDMQIKLLRVLENGEYFSIGSIKINHSNFRLISATNKDLLCMIRKGEFRLDLFHRINVITIKIPPLRERLDEIPFLVNYFLRELNREDVILSPDVMDLFLSYEWPGNIRELRNVLESAIAMLEDGERVIELRHLPLERLNGFENSYKKPSLSLKEREKRYRRMLIKHTMDYFNGDYKKVMESLQTSKDVIYRALAEVH